MREPASLLESKQVLRSQLDQLSHLSQQTQHSSVQTEQIQDDMDDSVDSESSVPRKVLDVSQLVDNSEPRRSTSQWASVVLQ
jgi:hypothetical protein